RAAAGPGGRAAAPRRQRATARSRRRARSGRRARSRRRGGARRVRGGGGRGRRARAGRRGRRRCGAGRGTRPGRRHGRGVGGQRRAGYRHGSRPAGGRREVTGPQPTPAPPGAGEVTATVIVRAPADKVYRAFTDWERQGEWIPFTQVRIVDGDGGEGSTIEAVTTVGPAVLRDVMRVVRLDPPYEVRVLHTGRMLHGPGLLRATPMDGGST